MSSPLRTELMPESYLKVKTWKHSKKGNQFCVEECPLCRTGGWHFFINSETGAWDCKKCGKSGSLSGLKKELGDFDEGVTSPYAKKQWKQPDRNEMLKYHNALLANHAAQAYIHSRGISDASIARFRLGLKVDEKMAWISIPHLAGNDLINIKYRSLPPATKSFQREPGCKSILFNQAAVAKHSEIIITEGELDAITLVQHGFENVVGATLGAGGFDADWVDLLAKMKKIFLCYDSDETGQNGAAGAAKRLGYSRCFNIKLPTKDANEFFLKQDSKAFQQCLKESSYFALPGIISCETAFNLLMASQKESNSGITTQWEPVNRLIHQWAAGDLIVVTALPKTGKTTWCLDITRDLVLQGIPVLFYCLEMRPERLILKLVQSQYRIKEPTPFHIQSARQLFAPSPIHFGYSYKAHKLNELMETLRESVRRFGLKLIVFDNLHYVCRSNQVNEEMAQWILAFKMLAEEMELPVIVIAQPRKRENPNEVMTAEDVRYSSAVHSDCDQMIVLHRNRIASKAKDMKKADFEGSEASMEPKMLVRIEAHRYGSGGETCLFYHGEYSRFDLMAPRNTTTKNENRRDING